MTQEKKNSVFISYSHADEKWLKRLKVHLRPLERANVIESWDDTRIQGGDEWRVEIMAALEKCKVAILLISADFMASDFIANDELPPLLKSAGDKGLIVIPVILSASSFLRVPEINKYQAINKPDQPVESLERSKQEDIFDKVAARVHELLIDNVGRQEYENPGAIGNKIDNGEVERPPKVSINVHSLDHGSFIELINSSEHSIRIDEVYIDEQLIDYLDMKWRDVDLPKLSLMASGSRAMLLFSIAKGISFNGSHLSNFEDWKYIEIRFMYGGDQEKWVMNGNITSQDNGRIKLSDIKIEKYSI